MGQYAVFTQHASIFPPTNRKYKRIFPFAMAEVHSVQVEGEGSRDEGLCWEVPLRLAESGDYRIPSAQTSHPPGKQGKWRQ
jgi:hypothetical protein